MGLPSINITFKQLASTIVTRSTKGKVGLIIFDDTNVTFTTKKYTLASDASADSALYTTANLQTITDCFIGTPASVTVIRVAKTGGTIAQALAILATLSIDWVGIADSSAVADQTALVSWIKSQEALNKTIKAVVYNATTAPDCKHIVNFVNTKVVYSDTRGEQNGSTFIPTLLGIFAGLAMTKSVTYYICTNLTSVTEVADNNVAIDAGKLVLINDGDSVVRIGSGVNSLTTVDTINTSDMKEVQIIEAIDMIKTDIRTTFKTYIGANPNSYDRQVLIIASINAYFKSLADEEILDDEYTNVATINVEAQRLALIASGKTAAADWTDAKVRNTSYKNSMFLTSNIKILFAMENLNLILNMA